MKPAHYHFILNPKARSNTGAAFFEGIEKKHFLDRIPYSKHIPTSPQNVVKTVQELAADDVVIVAVGGDGTINAVATGLAQSDSQAVMGIIPLGTGNALSYTLGLRRLSVAIETLLSGHIFPMDLVATGEAEMPYVIFMASVGFDSKILAIRTRLQRWGKFWSFPLALIRGIGTKPSRMAIRVDGRPFVDDEVISSALITNGHCYGFGIRAVPRTLLDDGRIELQIFPSKTAQMVTMLKYMLGARYYPENIRHIRGQFIQIDGEPAGQFDGDEIERPTFSLRVVPHAIRVLAATDAFFSTSALGQIQV